MPLFKTTLAKSFSGIRAALIVLLLGAPLVCAADTVAKRANAGQPAAIYQKYCSACHGEKGDGRSFARSALSAPPRDFTSDESARDLTRQYMIAIVREGRPHKPMVARSSQLSQTQIEAVVDFIRAAFIPPEAGTPMARGREIYRATCASCHGDRGQGGAAQGGIPPSPPLALSRAGAELTRDRMITAIARDKHGDAKVEFATPLAGPDTLAIVDYIQGAFIELAGGSVK